jgi:hypothetical protein
MSLEPLKEEIFPLIKEKITSDPDLKDKLLDDLGAGLESIGYYIKPALWDEMETKLRRILLDLKPLTEEDLAELEKKIEGSPQLQEALVEDLEAGLEALGYYLTDELFGIMDKAMLKVVRKGVKQAKLEMASQVEAEKVSRSITVSVKTGGEVK